MHFKHGKDEIDQVLVIASNLSWSWILTADRLVSISQPNCFFHADYCEIYNDHVEDQIDSKCLVHHLDSNNSQ